MSDFNLYSVNWQDGMLLSQQHLRDQERFLEELARWYGIPRGDAYGLVRAGSGAQPALAMSATVTGDRLRVEITRCQAITPDGYVISVNEASGQRLIGSGPAASGDVPVYISVAPEQKAETGDPDPSEDVPRLPYRNYRYTVHVGEEPGVPFGQRLPVAKLTVSGTEASHHVQYLPPCVTVYADERLHQRTASLRNRLETLLTISNRAYTTLIAGGAGVPADAGGLKGDLTRMIYQFVSYLSSTLDDFLDGRNAGHPIKVITYHKKLFRVFQTLLNLRPGIRDYMHEKYFVKQQGSDISQFVAAIDGFLMADYKHEELGRHFAEIESITDHIKGILGYMAQVKDDQLGPQAVATESLTYSSRTYKIVPYGGTRCEKVGDLTYLEVSLDGHRAMKDAVILLAKGLFSSTEWSNMHVRLGLNEARGLGETDPVEIDTTTYGDKVALHPVDMLQSQSVAKITLIFRGGRDASVFANLGKMDLFIYAQ
jgi:hypothetical protein